jgi:serine O-acetyltransferase|tara:strand:+ start:1097 stop:1987 length:891 start_codon:yes stop_codon:yes gene_type:complete
VISTQFSLPSPLPPKLPAVLTPTRRHKQGAQELAEKEPLLGGFLYSKILNQPSFERSLAFLIATKLATSTILASQWNDLIIDAITSSAEEEAANPVEKGKTRAPGTGSIAAAARADLEAIKERDPACPSYVHAFLFYKGFQGLQSQRVSHWLWGHGRALLACTVQSNISETFGMDLHPGAKFGRGIMIDHATGIVVGETAVVDDDCSLFHGVTLGGTGKVAGDRHPKLQKRVSVGAHASVLGNITIGHDSKIGASASILHDLPPRSVVVGHKGVVVRKKQGSHGTMKALSKPTSRL